MFFPRKAHWYVSVFEYSKFEFSAIIVHTERCGHVVTASFQVFLSYLWTLPVNNSDIVRSKWKSNHVNAPESIKWIKIQQNKCWTFNLSEILIDPNGLIDLFRGQLK